MATMQFSGALPAFHSKSQPPFPLTLDSVTDRLRHLLLQSASGSTVSTDDISGLVIALEEMAEPTPMPAPSVEATTAPEAPHRPPEPCEARGTAYARARDLKAQRLIASGDTTVLAGLLFPEAAQLWLESRGNSLRGRTLAGHKQEIKMLNRFFGDMRLSEIHIGHMLAYQEARTTNEGGMWVKPCGPSLVNHELGTVQQMMKRAGLWKQIADMYQPLEKAAPKQKVMTDEEERRFFRVAAANPEWQLAYRVALLTRNTGSAGSELRNLRFRDIDLENAKPYFVVDESTAKNEYRAREVPLNQTAVGVVKECMERARMLGSGRPEHYLFPFRVVPGIYDPMRATTDAWLHRTFGQMAEAAGVPWLTPHCLRHQFITLALERGVPPEVLKHIVGHVSEDVLKSVYNHKRMEKQTEVMELMDTNPSKPVTPPFGTSCVAVTSSARKVSRRSRMSARRHWI